MPSKMTEAKSLRVSKIYKTKNENPEETRRSLLELPNARLLTVSI
jgi:hypothetical protein